MEPTETNEPKYIPNGNNYTECEGGELIQGTFELRILIIYPQVTYKRKSKQIFQLVGLFSTEGQVGNFEIFEVYSNAEQISK